MYNHRLIISYKGTNYFGWQENAEGQIKPTVEGNIYKVLKKICKYKSCTISASSRTDAGVHAQGQVIKIAIAIEIDSQKLLLGMNSLLPENIRVLECQPCTKEFNPNKESKSKEYHYYFSTDTICNPLLNDIVTHVPANTKESKNGTVDIELMQAACKLFIGKHDFYNFAKRDTHMSSTFRTIVSCEILQAESSVFGNNIYYLKIVGKGFLRYMVRYIVAALFAIGRKELSLSDISEALENHKEEKVTSRAKSRGLHLIKVSY